MSEDQSHNEDDYDHEAVAARFRKNLKRAMRRLAGAIEKSKFTFKTNRKD